MDLLRRSHARTVAKEARRPSDAAELARAEFEYTWRGFWASPPGLARLAFKNGDHVFQYSIDALDHKATMTALVGSSTRVVRPDPSAVLNAVCREGWELVNGSFVFGRAEDGSRETHMGYYLLRRCDENREAETEDQLARRLGWSPTALDQAQDEAVRCSVCDALFADIEAYTTHYRSEHQRTSVR